MSTRYIADLHLYDAYSFGWRTQFANTDFFISNLIDKWNSVCEPEDIVIIVGDVGKPCPKTKEVIRHLNGNLILVVGNHDLVWGDDLYNAEYFLGTHAYINSNGIYVTHRPIVPDEIKDTVKYVVHGHHHQYDVPSMRSELLRYVRDTNRFNCCCDLIGYKPRTLQELMMQKELLLEKYREQGIL